MRDRSRSLGGLIPTAVVVHAVRGTSNVIRFDLNA